MRSIVLTLSALAIPGILSCVRAEGNLTRTQMAEQRQARLDEATGLLTTPTVTPEASTRSQTLMTEVRDLGTRIGLLDEAERISAEERQRGEAAEQRARAGRPALPEPGATQGDQTEQQRAADTAEVERRNRQHVAAMTRYVRFGDSSELRAMGTGAGTYSGAWGIPTLLADTIEQAILTFGGVAQYLGQLPTDNGDTIDYPVSNDTQNSAVIISEGVQTTEQDVAGGTVASNVSTLTTKYVLINNQLLQDSKFNLQTFIEQNLVERANRGLAGYIVNGSTDGNFDALKSVSVGYTTPAGQTTQLGYNDISGLFGAVDPGYASRGKWVMNRTSQLYLGALRNGLGAPIFQVDANGLLVKLFGQDVVIDTLMPNIGAGASPIVFGDLNKYLLRRVSGFSIRRYDELFGLSNQTAFAGFFRAGGRYLNAGTNPIQSLKMANA